MTVIDSLREIILSLLPAGTPAGMTTAVMVAVTALAAVATFYITRTLLVLAEKAVARSSTTWDDDILDSAMLSAVAQLAPAITVSYMLPRLFVTSPRLAAVLSTLTSLYILWAVTRIVTIFLGNLYNGLARRENTRAYAIKGIFQMLKLIAIGIAVIIGISIIINRQPGVILTAIGASAAVLMLVFKDTILGLVASIQLSANKMVQRGDWIAADGHNINGEVIDVSLTTVKVRNWDNSVSTIPPYSLVSDSFRNYEAMRLSGGRRVERSIPIDLSSVGFCSPELLKRLAEQGFLVRPLPDDTPVVNLTLLRRWLDHFLATDPRVNTSMTCMVRQLEPTATGVPLQLYFFTRTTEWKQYETEMADIFDHVYAVINTFGLRVFQSPTGADIAAIAPAGH